MSDLSSLPVAPEFVMSLHEHACQMVSEHLKSSNAPEEIVRLVDNMVCMSQYVLQCYKDPGAVKGSFLLKCLIEESVLQSINDIARSGGIFQGIYSESLPREITQS